MEFDYATVHAVWALRERGYETIMVNSNPETVSTDYDTADRLYFEPLTSEDVLHLVQHENPLGVIATLGGQTPLKLAAGLEAAGVRLLGTGQETIDLLEDRDRFGALCDQLGIARPEGWIAKDRAQAWAAAAKLTYPILARPSYVLGGRAMRVVRGPAEPGGVNDRLRDLRATRVVKVNDRLTVLRLRQGGKLLTNCVNVEHL